MKIPLIVPLREGKLSILLLLIAAAQSSVATPPSSSLGCDNKGCREIYDVPSRDICKETPSYCQFYKQFDGTIDTCNKYCKEHGGRCIRAYYDSGDNCDNIREARCDEEMGDGVCRCSMPECADTDHTDIPNSDADENSDYVTLRIKANIDGSSKLRIQNNKIWWKHYGWSAPGLHHCYSSDPRGCTGDPSDGCFLEGEAATCHRPTVINGVDWWPVWASYEDGNESRTFCGGCRTDSLDLGDIGIDLGPTPVLLKSKIVSDRPDGEDCDTDFCRNLRYGNDDKLWGDKCCSVATKDSQGLIEVNIFDHWGGQTASTETANYEITLTIKPCCQDDEDNIPDPDDYDEDDTTDPTDNFCSKTKSDSSIDSLLPDRYKVRDDGTFLKGASEVIDYTIQDTGYCSCLQILKKLGINDSQMQYGCKRETMSTWIEKLRYVEREVFIEYDRADAGGEYCIGLKNHVIARGNKLVMRECDEYDANQCWSIKYRKTGDEYFRLHPCETKQLCVQRYYGETSAGSKLKLNSCSSKERGQYFTFDGSNELIPARDNYDSYPFHGDGCIEPRDGSLKNKPLVVRGCSAQGRRDEQTWIFPHFPFY